MKKDNTQNTQATPDATDKDAEIEALKQRLADMEKKNAEEVGALEKQLAEEREKAAAPETPAAPDRLADPGNEIVTVHLFKDSGKYKDDVFVAVNGETCQIKRGVDVRVKRKFAEVLAQSARQDSATAELIERETSEFAKQAKRYDI